MFNSTLTRKRPGTMSVRPALYPLPSRTDLRHRASASRLQRQRLQPGHVSQIPFLSQLTVLEDGGTEQPPITRGQKHVRAKFHSRKTGRLQKAQGWGEIYLAKRNEAEALIFDYESHPFKYDGFLPEPGGSKAFAYFPDSVRQQRNRPPEVIEVKRSDRDLSDPEYREKLGLFREACRTWGWDFSVLTEDDIMEPGTPLIQQMTSVLQWADLELTPEEEDAAAQLLSYGVPISWADFSHAVAPDDPAQGDVVILHLLGTWRLTTPLNVLFAPTTSLEPVAPFAGKAEFRI